MRLSHLPPPLLPITFRKRQPERAIAPIDLCCRRRGNGMWERRWDVLSVRMKPLPRFRRLEPDASPPWTVESSLKVRYTEGDLVGGWDGEGEIVEG